jgi:ABC-type Fe3+-hydroxamate transport system substrate-binding protein
MSLDARWGGSLFGWVRSPVVLVLALAMLATVAAWGLERAIPERPARAPVAGRWVTLVSLSPAVTETLFAIGAGPQVVGVSDHCDHPPEVSRLPRVGTGFSPGYESIARLGPDWIVTDANSGSHVAELSAIARSTALPWLTLDDVLASIRKLGELTGRESAAAQLAGRLRARLQVEPAANAPRVLAVHGNVALERGEVWFIQDNSLHGAALRAAGGRNAVATKVTGPPQMSVERLLQVDPDLVIVLAGAAYAQPAAQDRLLAALRAIHALGAVRDGHIAVVQGSGVFATGPRILELVDQMASAIGKLRSTQ